MAFPSLIMLSVIAAFLLLVLSIIRLAYILPPFREPPSPRRRNNGAHLLIVLGSGGHTAEMLAMLDKAVFGAPPSTEQAATATTTTDQKRFLDWSAYNRRTWVVSSGDAFSALRAREFEAKVGADRFSGSYDIVTVPRARRVHQPLWSSPFSSLVCGRACAGVLLDPSAGFPDVILTNGPATATVLIFTSVLLRFFNVRDCNSMGGMRTVYVESWARVKAMSLSGRLLCWVADRVLVQWEQLATRGSRAEYHGVLCF